MSELEKPKRRFWQLHLSTLLILMVVSSVLVGVNCFRFCCSRYYDEDHEEYIGVRAEKGDGVGYGWPQIWISRTRGLTAPFAEQKRYDYNALFFDVCYGIIALAILVVTCESRITAGSDKSAKRGWLYWVNPFDSIVACIVAEVLLITFFNTHKNGKWGWPLWMRYSSEAFAGVYYLFATAVNGLIAVVIVCTVSSALKWLSGPRIEKGQGKP